MFQGIHHLRFLWQARPDRSLRLSYQFSCLSRSVSY
jgi:hypothetical protein